MIANEINKSIQNGHIFLFVIVILKAKEYIKAFIN
jgi:hypothetical protein